MADEIYNFRCLPRDEKVNRIKELHEDYRFICRGDKREVRITMP